MLEARVRTAHADAWAVGGHAARLAHLHADSEAAARVYRRLGFADTGELDVYVDL